jgi:tRNA threonylcarbamoyladenosine biosynthesis protein TsaE
LHNSHHTGSDEIDHATSRHYFGHLADETATLALGMKIAQVLHPGLVIFLKGDLGAGKTTLARGILRGLGYKGKVKSPTYNLIELYKISRLYFYHFDFYRFDNPTEWEEAGFREYFSADSICLVEWPEKAAEVMPQADLTFLFQISDRSRNIEIMADTEAGRLCLKHWQTLIPSSS